MVFLRIEIVVFRYITSLRTNIILIGIKTWILYIKFPEMSHSYFNMHTLCNILSYQTEYAKVCANIKPRYKYLGI